MLILVNIKPENQVKADQKLLDTLVLHFSVHLYWNTALNSQSLIIFCHFIQ